jgi:hypothetical protein
MSTTGTDVDAMCSASSAAAGMAMWSTCRPTWRGGWRCGVASIG